MNETWFRAVERLGRRAKQRESETDADGKYGHERKRPASRENKAQEGEKSTDDKRSRKSRRSVRRNVLDGKKSYELVK